MTLLNLGIYLMVTGGIAGLIVTILYLLGKIRKADIFFVPPIVIGLIGLLLYQLALSSQQTSMLLN